jgi:hypothetical protein
MEMENKSKHDQMTHKRIHGYVDEGVLNRSKGYICGAQGLVFQKSSCDK